MINILLTIFLASIFIFDWLFFVMGVGGRIMTWIPEFIALIIAVSLLLKTAVEKQNLVPLKYSFLIFLYLAHIVFGFLLNDITGWTMLAGLRIYTKFIPIFLLPLIFPLTTKAFRNIVLWIYALTMVQLPVVLYQRFIQFANVPSGDPVGGTLGGSASGILAIYLISIISFIIAFYFKDEISFPVFLISAAAAFIPITMNETKISAVLLPVAFIFPVFFIPGKREVIVKASLVLVLLVTSMVVFQTVYNYWQDRIGRVDLEVYYQDETRFERIKSRRLDPLIDSVTVAPKGDLRFALFGRGAGNVSEGFTRILSGKYLQERSLYGVSMTFPKLMWELGFVGTVFFFLFPLLVFFDAFRLSRQPGFNGAYALGMLSLTLFFVLSTAYTFTIDNNVLIFLYFFAAGQLVRLSVETRNEKETVTSYDKERLPNFA
jgi:hypothetical protein